MKTRCSVALLLFAALTVALAKEANWTGNYTDKKYLNGQAVFQLNILQEGETISIDFDATYSDGQGCAPEASGAPKVADEDTLKFTVTDSSNNSGSGTMRRAGDGLVISLKTTRVTDPRCVVFYGENIRLSPAKSFATPSGGNDRPAPEAGR